MRAYEYNPTAASFLHSFCSICFLSRQKDVFIYDWGGKSQVVCAFGINSTLLLYNLIRSEDLEILTQYLEQASQTTIASVDQFSDELSRRRAPLTL